MKDKIILWLGTNLTYFGLAKSLQDKYDCDLFAIVDITAKPKKFFQEQEIVRFKKIWFYHDHIHKNHIVDVKYLQVFEEKYKINLWLLAQNERIFYRFNQFHKFSSDEILSILEQECKLFEQVLDEAKPDFLMIYMPTLHQIQLFYELSKARGIKILVLRSTPFGYRYMITQQAEKIHNNSMITNNNTRSYEDLLSYLKEYDSFKQGNDFLSEFQNSNLQYFKAIIKFFFTSYSNVKSHYTYYGRSKIRVLSKMLVYTIKKKSREYFMKKNLITQINDQSPFVYFPLHIEQEQVLLISAPFYTNQIEIIRHVTKSLPVGYKLFVKEHPVMSTRGWRSISEYKEIMQIPNVVLIHPSLKSENLIKKSSLVITINGTSSIEAAFYKKPSIMFANTDNSYLSFIEHVESIDELPKIIRKSLNKEISIERLNQYVDFIVKNSFELDLGGLENKVTNYFYFGGFLVDTEIYVDSMKKFLKDNETPLNILADEFIKRLSVLKQT